MTILSVRGLDTKAPAELKRRAAHEEASVNTLVVMLIEQELGLRRAKPLLRRHSDLDALAGSWTKQQDCRLWARVVKRSETAWAARAVLERLCREFPQHVFIDPESSKPFSSDQLHSSSNL